MDNRYDMLLINSVTSKRSILLNDQLPTTYPLKIQSTIKYKRINIISPFCKSQQSQPLNAHNKKWTELNSLRFSVLFGFVRQFRCTKDIPLDIIHLLSNYFDPIIPITITKKTAIIALENQRSFDIIDLKSLDITRYEALSLHSNESTQNCFAHNISLPNHIIDSFNQQYNRPIYVDDKFNVIFFITYKNDYTATIFNNYQAFEVKLPSCSHYNGDAIYSNKYGLIFVDRYQIYNFSLNEWKWNNFGKINYQRKYTGTRQDITYQKAYGIPSDFLYASHYMMLNDNMAFKATKQHCFMLNFDTLKAVNCSKPKESIGNEPVMCYDDSKQRIYVNVKTALEQFDVVSNQWKRFLIKNNKRCKLLWIDEKDRNLLYKC